MRRCDLRLQVKIRCPFYVRLSTERLELVCEGVTEGGETVHRFADADEMRRQLDGYCKKEYTACGVCRMCERKYD